MNILQQYYNKMLDFISVVIIINALNYQILSDKIKTRKSLGIPCEYNNSRYLLAPFHILEDAKNTLCVYNNQHYLGEVVFVDISNDIMYLELSDAFWENYDNNYNIHSHKYLHIILEKLLFSNMRKLKISRAINNSETFRGILKHSKDF